MNTALTQIASDYTVHTSDGPPWPFFPIIPLLFLTAFVLFVIFGPRRWRGRHDAAGTVRELYARGEISADEMRQRLDALRANRE